MADPEDGARVLRIFVVVHDQKAIVLKLPFTATAFNVKTMLQEKEGLLASHFRLQVRDHFLDDHLTLQGQGVVDGDTIVVIEADMLVTVTRFENKIVRLYVQPSNLVAHVKGQLQQKEGIAPHLQDLFNGHVLLHDSQTLSECNVHDGTVLRLVTRTARMPPTTPATGSSTGSASSRSTTGASPRASTSPRASPRASPGRGRRSSP
jgi:hypothetical protein